MLFLNLATESNNCIASSIDQVLKLIENVSHLILHVSVTAAGDPVVNGVTFSDIMVINFN